MRTIFSPYWHNVTDIPCQSDTIAEWIESFLLFYVWFIECFHHMSLSVVLPWINFDDVNIQMRSFHLHFLSPQKKRKRTRKSISVFELKWRRKCSKSFGAAFSSITEIQRYLKLSLVVFNVPWNSMKCFVWILLKFSIEVRCGSIDLVRNVNHPFLKPIHDSFGSLSLPNIHTSQTMKMCYNRFAK